ncbi:uncharacterized mitochondrial protein-like protein [Tanacetum coccineum]
MYIWSVIKAHSDSIAPSDASDGFDLPPLSHAPDFDLPIALRKVLKIIGEALAHSGWRVAMVEEMNFLDHNGCILLVVYVDDIVITGSDKVGIKILKSFIDTCFQTKDLGLLKYFLAIEVSYSSKVIIEQRVKVNQKAHILDLKQRNHEDYCSDNLYTVSIKEDMTYLCLKLHSASMKEDIYAENIKILEDLLKKIEDNKRSS